MGNSLCLCRALSIYEFKSDRLLGVRYVSFDSEVTVAGLSLFDKDAVDNVFYYENTRAKPKFQVYGQAAMVADVNSAVNKIHSTTEGCLLIESGEMSAGADAGLVCDGVKNVVAKIDVREASSTRYSFSIDSDSDAWLFIADANYPGWVATVNGASRQVYSAQILGKAVKINAGRNIVEVSYAPKMLYAGAAISAVASLFVALLAFYGFARRIYVSRASPANIV